MGKKELMDYLNEQDVKDKTYIEFILKKSVDKEDYKQCTINKLTFKVSHFLDESSRAGFGIIPTNKILNTTKKKCLAIGLIEGDDIICIDTINGSIFIWMIQTGEGERIKVAESFKDFINICLDV